MMDNPTTSTLAMQVDEVRIDLLDIYSTVDLLRGLPKNPDAPFEFLTAKPPYNSMSGRVQRREVSSIEAPPLSLSIDAVCEPAAKSFWRGTDVGRSRLR